MNPTIDTRYPRAFGAAEAHVRELRIGYQYAQTEARKDELVRLFLARFDRVVADLDVLDGPSPEPTDVTAKFEAWDPIRKHEDSRIWFEGEEL